MCNLIRLKYDDGSRLREQIGILVGMLESENESTRKLALVQLSLLGPKATPYLVSALRESVKLNSILMEGIIDALGIIADPGSVSDLSAVLPNAKALESLAKIGTKEALEVVIKELPSWYYALGNYSAPEGSWRENQVNELARRIFDYFGDEGIDALIYAVENSDYWQFYACACAVLPDWEGDDCISALIKCLKQNDPEIRMRGLAALKTIKASIPPEWLDTELEFAYRNGGYSEGAQYSRTHFVDSFVHRLISKETDDGRLDQGDEKKDQNKWGGSRNSEYFSIIIDSMDDDHVSKFLFDHSWEKSEEYGTPQHWLKPRLEKRLLQDGSAAMPSLIRHLEKGSDEQQQIAAHLVGIIKNPKLLQDALKEESNAYSRYARPRLLEE